VNFWILGAIVAVMVVLRFLKIGLLAWAITWIAAFYTALRFGFIVPIPVSVIFIYMGVSLLAMFAYVTSSRERRAEVSRPLLRLMTEPRLLPLLVALTLLIPAVAATAVYARLSAPIEPPFFSRTVHPASPALVTVHEKSIDLDGGTNPFAALATSNPDEYKAHLAEGRRVYYQNCVFCHGDDMGGNGMFIHGLNPIPTNFTDPGTIPMLRDTFLFWRISKGGPGLPEEGGPWDTAMPAWEKFLSEDEIWDAILFVYDFTGYKPRAKEGEHAK
jgi:cbb3-type cytochrome c oxidase subunit III